MIIQPSHHHHHSEDEYQQQQQFDEGVLSILKTIMSKSQSLLNQNSNKEIQRLRRYYEQKVYLSYCDDPSQYLLHMLHKSQSENGDHVAQMVMNRQKKIVNAIKQDRFQLKINNEGQKIKKIKDQLSNKISEMKQNLEGFQSSQLKYDNADNLYKGIMQFRRKGYWNQQTQQSKKVKSFVSKMKKQRKKMDQQHQKHVKQTEQYILQQMENDKKMKDDEQKKLMQFMLKKRQKLKNERKQKSEMHMKKLQQANSFLQKFKGEKPMFLLNQQKFKKQVLDPMEQQKKRKLNEIKKVRKPIDPQQLQLHQQRYQQFKQKLLEVYDKRQQDNELYEKNMQKLKQLYHGRFHEKIQEQMNNFSNIVQQKKKMRQKINSYSAGVKQQFKPKIDTKKKQQLQNLIKILTSKSVQKGKRKIKNQDGSYIFQEISPFQHKKLGVSYLEQLKKYNQGKKRKDPQDRSQSMLQLSKKKIIYPDYLQENRSKSRVQTSVAHSRNGWRKVMSQQGYSNRDKYNSVMDHVSLLEHEAKQKEIQLKHMKNGTKALQLKQKLDKYYLQSVAAKMHVLKDVILKQ